MSPELKNELRIKELENRNDLITKALETVLKSLHQALTRVDAILEMIQEKKGEDESTDE